MPTPPIPPLPPIPPPLPPSPPLPPCAAGPNEKWLEDDDALATRVGDRHMPFIWTNDVFIRSHAHPKIRTPRRGCHAHAHALLPTFRTLTDGFGGWGLGRVTKDKTISRSVFFFIYIVSSTIITRPQLHLRRYSIIAKKETKFILIALSLFKFSRENIARQTSRENIFLKNIKIDRETECPVNNSIIFTFSIFT